MSSGESEGPGAVKRQHVEAGSGAAASAGRGSAARPPGAPPNPIAEVLADIKAQLSQQSAKLEKLADKDDVRGISLRVNELSDMVAGHSDEITKIRTVQDEDRTRMEDRMEELERKVEQLSSAGVPGPSSDFNKERFQRERYQICRRSLRLWPVPVVLGGSDEQFTRTRAAVCVFLRDLLKIDSPEDLDMEDISFPRVVSRSKIRNEVLVRFATISERDEVISHAVNLRDSSQEAGVRLEIPDHLQADFKVLIQY